MYSATNRIPGRTAAGTEQLPILRNNAVTATTGQPKTAAPRVSNVGQTPWADRASISIHCNAKEGACSRDRLKKLDRFHPQCMRQFDDVDEADVAFAPLDSTDVVSMQVRQLRQAFLREAALHPQFANASAE